MPIGVAFGVGHDGESFCPASADRSCCSFSSADISYLYPVTTSTDFPHSRDRFNTPVWPPEDSFGIVEAITVDHSMTIPPSGSKVERSSTDSSCLDTEIKWPQVGAQADRGLI